MENKLPMLWTKDTNPELNGEDFKVVMQWSQKEQNVKLSFQRGEDEWSLSPSGVKLLHRMLSQTVTGCESCSQ